MSKSSLRTPILFLIFNRLDTTKQVFSRIRRAKPSHLYIAADGPRSTHPNEVQTVNIIRDYILSEINWSCKVRTLFREQNLGCKRAIEDAINWFFEYEPMGIILEDDCLPSHSFFWFCESLLEMYKDDERLMMISGLNTQGTWKTNRNDYFFSNLGGIWGWASWSRAWSLYDSEMTLLDLILEEKCLQGLLGSRLGRLREHQIQRVKSENVDTWDYAWGLSRHINSGLTCVPSKNLIRNIGFGEMSTHTARHSSSDKDPLHEIKFPLRENKLMIADHEYDNKFFGRYEYFKEMTLSIWRHLK